MRKSQPLSSALKSANPIIKQYVHDLEIENAKLQKLVAKLEVKNVTQYNRIKSLEKEMKKGPIHNFQISFDDDND